MPPLDSQVETLSTSTSPKALNEQVQPKPPYQMYNHECTKICVLALERYLDPVIQQR